MDAPALNYYSAPQPSLYHLLDTTRAVARNSRRCPNTAQVVSTPATCYIMCLPSPPYRIRVWDLACARHTRTTAGLLWFPCHLKNTPTTHLRPTHTPPHGYDTLRDCSLDDARAIYRLRRFLARGNGHGIDMDSLVVITSGKQHTKRSNGTYTYIRRQHALPPTQHRAYYFSVRANTRLLKRLLRF